MFVGGALGTKQDKHKLPQTLCYFCTVLLARCKCYNKLKYLINQQEAFEKCWAHSPLRAAARRIAIHQVSLLSHAATVARRLHIDVHDNDNDNAWQRGPLWPHRMGPISFCLYHKFNEIEIV